VLTDPLFVNNNVFLFSTCIIALALRWQGQKRIMSELALLDALEEKRQTLQRSAEEMQQQNEEMKSFTSIVSHDLRAPLVNIKGFSGELRFLGQEMERVVGGAPTDDGGKVRLREIVGHDLPQALGFIEASVQRMDGQISALLTLSRIGRRELAPQALDMDDLVRGLLVTLAHQIEEKRAAVVVGALPSVTADRTAMEQIVGNLLDNALKYLEPGREGRLEISGDRNSDHAVFRVRDNGRGIAAEDIPRAFEVFRRVGRQDVPGEGMGLAYVKALVRRHGGRIWCEAEPGAGAVFTFTIAVDGQPGLGMAPGERS
jgi:signal transduction histidine kinase